jgi:hypothetical protein
MLLFTSTPPNKRVHSFQDLLPHEMSGSYASTLVVALVFLTPHSSQCCYVCIVEVGNLEVQGVVAPSSMIFIPSFMKICQLIQNLLWVRQDDPVNLSVLIK